MTGGSSGDALVAKVAAALQTIPHAADCEMGNIYDVGRNGYVVNVAGHCSCDRDERIAQRVALWMEDAWVAALNNQGMEDVVLGERPRDPQKGDE